MREEWRPAGFGDRWFADLCDAIMGLALAGLAYLLIDKALLHAQAAFLDDATCGATQVVLLIWFLWNLTYLVGATGQSWGRMIAGLKVVDADGDPIGFWRSLGRNLFAMYVSAPLFYLGFLWVIWDSQKQAWHDKVFRTFVLRRVVL